LENPERPVLPTFRDVFDEHAAFVWRTLRTLGVPESALDDTVQEVFMTVHSKWAEFEGRSSLRTWICAITYRVAANARRKVQRNQGVETPNLEMASPAPGPEEQAREAESSRFVERFCADLNEGMRDVFVFCLLEGRPAVEVAALLGISANTVASRVRLLRESFRKAIEIHYSIRETT
jgi:RNA polymerase sigma-70 factor, ECF subfamily